MLVIVDEVANEVHLMGLTWPELFALGASVINTAQLTAAPDVHAVIDPLLDGIDAATECVLNEPTRRASGSF